MAVKTFTDNTSLPASDINTYLNNGGLVYVAQTTFTNTTTPFINGCFNSTYDNYRIMVAITGTTTSDVRARLRYSTSTVENGAVYDRYGFVATTVYTGSYSASQTSAILCTVVNGTADVATVVIDLFSAPLANKNTNFVINGWSAQTGGTYFFNNRVLTNREYTGIEMTPDSGSISGSIRVYGYRQA